MIVGLMGYAQVGKDTVAKTLVEEHGFTRIAFADALRDCVYALNPIVQAWAGMHPEHGLVPLTVTVQNLVNVHGWDKAKQNPEVRRLLQVMGTEVGRDIIAPNVWVDIAMRKVHATGRYVFTDVRFPNESTAIARERGTLVRVRRQGFEPVNGHSSETAVDHVEPHFTIYNDGSLERLAGAVNVMLSAIDHV